LKYLPLALSLLLFTFAYSAKGPQYRSTRVHGMGGAYVAVADGKDALYYNPAGLNLINRLGNFEKDPDMGYMPRSHYDVRLLSTAFFLPANEIDNTLSACGKLKFGRIIKKLILFDYGNFGDPDYWCPIYNSVSKVDSDDLPEYLDNHPELANNLVRLDRSKIEIGTQVSLLEIVVPNFGYSAWVNSSVAPYIDLGIFVPTFGYEPVQVDVVNQAAFAFSPVDKWSVGAGLKLAARFKQSSFDFMPGLDFKDGVDSPTINTDELDSLGDSWNDFGKDAKDPDFAVGLDLGVLYQITRQVRLGTSIRNIFFGKLADESITPNWSIGAMASPMILQSNSLWGRKVNFAIDYVDMLDGTITEKFFSHLNFGAEIDQVVIPSPTKDLPLGYRFLFGVVGGAIGLGVGSVIGDGYGAIGTAVGMGVGTIAGFKFGTGGDALRVSLGGGYEGGWPAFNVGLGLFGDVITMRFGSYVEERGMKTGQDGHRFWMGEISVGF